MINDHSVFSDALIHLKSKQVEQKRSAITTLVDFAQRDGDWPSRLCQPQVLRDIAGLLSSADDVTKRKTIRVLFILASQYPDAQGQMGEAGILYFLFDLLEHYQQPIDMVKEIVCTIGCLVKKHPRNQEALVGLSGVRTMFKLLRQRYYSEVQSNVVSVLLKLVGNPILVSEFCQENGIAFLIQLLPLLDPNHQKVAIHGLNVLLCEVRDNVYVYQDVQTLLPLIRLLDESRVEVKKNVIAILSHFASLTTLKMTLVVELREASQLMVNLLESEELSILESGLELMSRLIQASCIQIEVSTQLLSLLIALLDSRHPAIQQGASEALKYLVASGSGYCDRIRVSGGIAPLLRCLESLDSGVQQSATNTLNYLVASSPENKQEIGCSENMQLILNQLSLVRGDLKKDMLSLVRQLMMQHHQNQLILITQLDTLPILIDCLKDDDWVIRYSTVTLLGCLLMDDESIRALIESKGVSLQKVEAVLAEIQSQLEIFYTILDSLSLQTPTLIRQKEHLCTQLRAVLDEKMSMDVFIKSAHEFIPKHHHRGYFGVFQSVGEKEILMDLVREHIMDLMESFERLDIKLFLVDDTQDIACAIC